MMLLHNKFGSICFKADNLDKAKEHFIKALEIMKEI